MTPPATLTAEDFKVADLSLADFGRKEIRLAEHEMPGLMSIRREFQDAQPLRGARMWRKPFDGVLPAKESQDPRGNGQTRRKNL
jgi:hypothetical protein